MVKGGIDFFDPVLGRLMFTLRSLPEVALACVLPLCAQNFGEIMGTVMDPSGGAAVEAIVTVTNAATNVARRVETNTTGNYSVPFLVPGHYTVHAELAGFRAVTRTEVEVQVGAVERVDFTLQIGKVSESVEVKSDAALLATESIAMDVSRGIRDVLRARNHESRNIRHGSKPGRSTARDTSSAFG
jgi:hypothetical protein